MISLKNLKELLADEKHGAKRYEDLGWHGLAKAEMKHYRFLKMMYDERTEKK